MDDRTATGPAQSPAQWWWSMSAPRVIAVMILPAALGSLVDLLVSGEPGLGFSITFVAGCVAAAALARRSALFVSAVQPPLGFLAFGIAFSLILRDNSGAHGLLTSVAVDTGLWLTTWFPVLAAATLPAVAIAGVKGFLAAQATPPAAPGPSPAPGPRPRSPMEEDGGAGAAGGAALRTRPTAGASQQPRRPRPAEAPAAARRRGSPPQP